MDILRFPTPWIRTRSYSLLISLNQVLNPCKKIALHPVQVNLVYFAPKRGLIYFNKCGKLFKAWHTPLSINHELEHWGEWPTRSELQMKMSLGSYWLAKKERCFTAGQSQFSKQSGCFSLCLSWLVCNKHWTSVTLCFGGILSSLSMLRIRLAQTVWISLS